MNTQELLDALDDRPIPPDAIDELCQRVASDHHRSKGRTELADRLDVSEMTVARWIMEKHPCNGTSASLVEQVGRQVVAGI